VHANSVASELLAVIAQRLAKRICKACREPAIPDTELAHEVFKGPAPEGFACFRGRGCARCSHLGTRGRIGVVEFLPANPALRSGIAQRLAVDDLRQVALAAGLVPMREQALDLVEQGIISFAELKTLLPPERLVPERPKPRGTAHRPQ
jgi:type IV pilus assembly protein PilB